ncbi:MAG TPA: hypothetical protein VN253_20370 [Kofleriaceae bacterium]|nr:hypothetical protein [Kofleriaceae bacterium]
MRNSSLLALSITAGLGLGVAACADDPPPPDEVRARISTDLAHVLREGSAAIAGGTEGLPGAAASGMLDRVLGTDSGISPRLRTALTSLTARGVRGVRPADGPYDPDAGIAFLNDKLFTDANHLGDGIYQVPPAVVCAQTAVDGSGTPVETIDPTCADHLAAAQLRIRVSTSGAQLRFAIQLGAEHDEPLTIGLEHAALSVTIDLDDTWRAAVALAKLLGEDLPNAALAGQVTGRFEILGTAHAKATLDIDRAVSIAFAQTGVALDGPDAFRFTSAKAKLLAIELDGAAQHGSLALGLGATTARLVADDGTGPRHLELDLPGVTGKATFGAGLPLELTSVSLGDRTTTLLVDGRPAMTIDLNPDAGRAFAARLSLDAATGRESLEVTPKLDLRMAVDHAVRGDAAPVYDVTQLLLDGSVRADAIGDRLEVLTGTLRLTTSPAAYGFSATAGDCVLAREVADAPSGQLYTAWTVGICL